MDLNVDNYSINELFNTLQLSQNNEKELDIKTITVTKLQNCLLGKIEKIKLIDTDVTNLPTSKESLIEFYTKAFFKIINDRNMINELRTGSNNTNNTNNMNEKQENSEYRDAYGNKSGNVYNASYENPNQTSASIQEKLLEPMQSTHTVQESSRFVTQHNNYNPISTFNSNLKAGVINPLVRKSIKKILNINTRFRNNYSATNSANFTMDLPSTIKKVVSMRLVDIDLPKTVYTFSSKLGSNTFKIDGSLVKLDDGAYTADALIENLNLNPVLSNKSIELKYGETTGLITIKKIGTPTPDIPFNLDFTYDSTNPNLSCQENIIPSNVEKNQLTLGWMLGFRGNYTNKNKIQSNYETNTEYCRQKIQRNNQNNNKGKSCSQYEIPKIYCETNIVKNYNNLDFKYDTSSSYIGESLFDMYGSRYFLLSINDYQNNHGELIISPFKDQTLASNNILAKIQTACQTTGGKEFTYPERIYFGPTNISKLHIILYDEFGRIVDLNNSDYSLTLEIEVIYDL
jgi:hypothetical protein